MVLMTGNGEKGLSIRTKINNLISYFLEPGHRAKNVALLVASTTFTYSAGSLKTVAAGDIITTKSEGFKYEVQALGTANYDLATAGGVLLNVLPGDNGAINFRAMNPAANGSTDDYPLLQKLLDKPAFRNTGDTRYGTVLSIYFPRGSYFMGSTLDLKRTVRLWSDAGFPSEDYGRLVFAQNAHGIIVNRFNTFGGTEAATTTAADGTEIYGLAIVSAGGTDRTKAGICIKARCAVRSCYVGRFPGNGIQVIAGAGDGGTQEGNANCFYIENTTCELNRNHGFYTDGADANAGYIVNLDCRNNGRCGIWDSSFLGNTYVACHTATNGLAGIAGNTSSQSSIVNFGGRQWIARWTATEAQLVATQPGTNANVWIDRAAEYIHPTVPTWQSGQPEGTYFVAYGYLHFDLNADSVFIGCYNEMDNSCVFLGRAVPIGGSLGDIRAGGRLAANDGQFSLPNLATANGPHGVRITDGTSFETWIGTGNILDETWRWKRTANGGILLDNRNLGARIPLQITGNADAIPFKFSVAEFLLAGRLHGGATSAPATGTGVAGEVRWNTAGTRGQPFAWMRTNDGTWQPLGLIP